MSDLAKDLLSEYYGIGVESAGNKFVSIPECRKNVTNEYKRSIDEQTSSITEEKDSSIKQDSQEQFDDNECTDEKSNNFPKLTRGLTQVASDDDLTRQFDTFDVDLGSNVIFDTLHNPLSSVQLDKGNTPDDVPVDIPKENGDVNNSNPEVINGIFPDNTSDVSWHVQSKKSQKSLINFTTPLPPVPKKEPVYNKTFVDLSNTELTMFPIVLFNKYSSLRMLYLEKNSLTELPDELFSVLQQLEWLDVRNNQIKYLPVSIKSHPCLETLLVDGNHIEKLPLELCSVTKLKTLHVADNPIIEPPKDIVAQGCSAIINFLRSEWNKLHPEEIIEISKKDIQPTLNTIICYKPLSSSENNSKFENLRSGTSVSRKVSSTERSRSYKPSNRCRNTRINFLTQQRELWFCQVRKTLTQQESILQKIKNEYFLKRWRQDKRSFAKSMQKARNRNKEDDCPFIGDLQNSGTSDINSKGTAKCMFPSPGNVDTRISELADTLKEIETSEDPGKLTSRTGQAILQKNIDKISQVETEIRYLKQHIGLAM